MSCIVCGEDGAYFAGTPRAERLFFIARAMWALHKARQALEPDSNTLAAELSDIIRRLESVAELALDLDPTQ